MIRAIQHIVCAILSVVLVGCYNATDKPVIDATLPHATTTIAHLRDVVVGTGGCILQDDFVVVGYVITSDCDANIFRTIIVDDGTGAIEVMMGLYDLGVSHPEGLLVALRLQGCYADYSYGVLQVGRKAHEYDPYAVEYLNSREAVARVVVCSDRVESISARRCTIGELAPSMLGRLVELEGLHLVDADDDVWGGYSLFKDRQGDSIALYTRPYATFADHPLPRDEVSIRGILHWGEYAGDTTECYQLKMRYEEDCTTL